MSVIFYSLFVRVLQFYTSAEGVYVTRSNVLPFVYAVARNLVPGTHETTYSWFVNDSLNFTSISRLNLVRYRDFRGL